MVRGGFCYVRSAGAPTARTGPRPAVSRILSAAGSPRSLAAERRAAALGASGTCDNTRMGKLRSSEAQSACVRAARRQCADAVLMVRPACFGYNPETATTNAFQDPDGPSDAAGIARAEFDAFAAALRGEGVQVCVVDDTPDPPKPDAVFPNNWVSFHADGTLVLYPMQARSRRIERRQQVLDAAIAATGFRVSRVLDLTAHEREGRYLEGTGSLVLDHPQRLAYVCRSSRSDPRVLEEWSRELGYEPITFDAADAAGRPIYHTNVVLSIGERAALVGLEALAAADRDRVLERLRATGREVIELDRDQLRHFAANVLELASWDEALGDYHLLVMAATARQALAPQTFARVAACVDEVLVAPVPTIERLGGGSVRCMLAEVFRPA